MRDSTDEGEIGHTDFKPKAGKTLADINGTRKQITTIISAAA